MCRALDNNSVVEYFNPLQNLPFGARIEGYNNVIFSKCALTILSGRYLFNIKGVTHVPISYENR